MTPVFFELVCPFWFRIVRSWNSLKINIIDGTNLFEFFSAQLKIWKQDKMAVLTCLKISTRCCSSLLKNLNTLNRSFSNRAFHNVCITKCKTVLQKQIHSDKVIIYRQLTTKQSNQSNHRSTIMYAMAGGIFMIGAAYAMVPLYRILCQVS